MIFIADLDAHRPLRDIQVTSPTVVHGVNEAEIEILWTLFAKLSHYIELFSAVLNLW